MPRTVIPIQDQLTHDITLSALIATNVADGLEFSNNGFVRLVIVASPTFAGGTVTIKGVLDSNRRIQDIVKTIAANNVWTSAFFPVSLFASGGKTSVDVSVATGLTIAAIRQQL